MSLVTLTNFRVPKDGLGPCFRRISISPNDLNGTKPHNSRCKLYLGVPGEMPKVVPSDVVAAIDQLFGSSRNPMDSEMIQYRHRAEVQTVLALLDDIPRPLITLSVQDYIRLQRCRASLGAALSTWTGAGHGEAAQQVEMSDPVALLQSLLKQCPDDLPPPVDLAVVDDPVMRRWIEERGAAAWIDFGAREWLGAAVMAGSTLEGLLLWCLRQAANSNALTRRTCRTLLIGRNGRAAFRQRRRPRRAWLATLGTWFIRVERSGTEAQQRELPHWPLSPR